MRSIDFAAAQWLAAASCRLLIYARQPLLQQDGPGFLGEWLTAQGIPWHLRCAEAGEDYPASVRGYRGLAVLGGAWSANDERPTVRQAEALIREADALGFLAEEGNPFAKISYDPKGKTRLDWGVTAPPETFIVGGDGTVLYKFIGPLVGDDYMQRFRPELDKALAK